MNRTMKKLTAGLLAAVLGVSVAYAAGMWTFPTVTAITGFETVPADTNLPNGLNPATVEISTAQIAGAAVVASLQSSIASNTAAFTATTAQVTPGPIKVLSLTGTLAGAANVTTPTAAAWIAAAPGLATQPYTLIVQNASSANFAWTVVGGVGVTVSGNAVIAQGAFAYFAVSQQGSTMTLTRLQ